MKKTIILLFCVLFLSCKNKNEEQKLIYKQLINYREELKMNSRNLDNYINIRAAEDKSFKSATENSRKVLVDYENNFENLKYKEREKLVNLRNFFKKENNLFLNFETSNYNQNVSDTIFNRLMEIDFYRSKIDFQNRYLMRQGCK